MNCAVKQSGKVPLKVLYIGPKKPQRGEFNKVYVCMYATGWVNKSRLLGITVDDKLSWVPHMLDLKKTVAKKLDLIGRSRILPRDVLINFYFKVILPSVTYSLILWGSCFNADVFDSLE